MAHQRQIRICREGFYFAVVVLAVLIGAVTRQLNLLMLLGSVLAGPLVASLVLGRVMLWRVVVERRLPPNLSADARLVVDVAITNRHRWLGLWGIVVEDTVCREGAPLGERPTRVGVFFPAVAGRETRHVSYDGQLGQRGRYRFGPLRVSTRFPLGLFRHVVVLDRQDELLVHPALGHMTRDWARPGRENTADSQRMQRRGAIEADFYGLRDWRTGDSRRWIHWRTSARRGSLVVRQFEQRRTEEFALLVDLWQPNDPTEAQLANVETAVSFAATVVAEACRRRGRHVALHLAAREPIDRSGLASPVFFRELMDALAVALPHDRSDLPRSLGHALAVVPAAVPTLVVSTRPIDRHALQQATAQREGRLAGRSVQLINVAGGELAEYFHV